LREATSPTCSPDVFITPEAQFPCNCAGLSQFNVTAEEKAEITKKLKAGKTHTFRPAGFGIGYTLHTRQRSRWDDRAKPELEEFFGVPRIWLESIDCD